MVDKLGASGWKDRVATVVIDPELEAWVWSDSPVVDRVLGWSGRIPSLRDWLRDEKFLSEDKVKPTDPKCAVNEALRMPNKQRSSAIYFELAQQVSFQRCTDTSFQTLRTTLANWFGVNG